MFPRRLERIKSKVPSSWSNLSGPQEEDTDDLASRRHFDHWICVSWMSDTVRHPSSLVWKASSKLGPWGTPNFLKMATAIFPVPLALLEPWLDHQKVETMSPFLNLGRTLWLPQQMICRQCDTVQLAKLCPKRQDGFHLALSHRSLVTISWGSQRRTEATDR